jgi:NTE family protein
MNGRDGVIGMVLAGGGARGAYSAGVMRYLFRELPKRIGYIPWPKIVSGTSVGALNGYFAASHSMYELDRMEELWTEIRIGKIFNIPDGAIASIRRLLSSARQAALLDPTPLSEIIVREAKRKTLRQSIDSGHCKAFFVSATMLRNGKNILFTECADPEFQIPPPPMGEVVRTRLYPQHLMASCAIPMVFPPVQVDKEYYIDGGVRQNAPLHPVLYSGADRIIILSTKATRQYSNPAPITPSLPLVGGKTLNALTLDPVERDSANADRINSLIQWGIGKYGPEFGEDLYRDLGLRPIKILHIRPSIDLGRLAVQTCRPEKLEATAGAKWLVQKIASQAGDNGESDLLSQLFFDHSFTRPMEQLGFDDAKAMEDELSLFLDSP